MTNDWFEQHGWHIAYVHRSPTYSISTPTQYATYNSKTCKLICREVKADAKQSVLGHVSITTSDPEVILQALRMVHIIPNIN